MKKRPLTLDRFLKAFFPYLKKHGMEEDNIKRYFQSWLKSHPGGSVNDFAWMIFNTLLHELPKQIGSGHPNFYHTQKEIYSQMVSFQWKFESKNANHLLQQMFKSEIRHYETTFTFATGYEIIAHKDCPHAMKYDGKIYEANELLKEIPIANSGCVRSKGCGCSIACVTKRDKNDRPIPKMV